MSINAMHTKSGLCVLLEWEINRPDSVIADVIRLKHGRRHPVFEENRTGCSYSVRMDRATGYLPMVPRSSFDCSRSATRFSEIQNPRSFCCRYRVNGRARNIRTTYATFPPHSPFPFLYVFCRAVTLAFHPRGSRLHRLRRLTSIEYTTLTKATTNELNPIATPA